MVGDVRKMVEEAVEMLKALEENEDFFKTTAKIYAKMRDALIAEGFTREEAVEIVKANPVKFE